MQSFIRLLKLATIAILLSSVVGCGFKLRGMLTVPSYLKTVYITPVDPYEPFQRELRYRLKRVHINVICYPNDNVTVLEIYSPEFKEEILAYSTSGQVQRSKLTYSIKYRLTTKDASDIDYTNTVMRTRELSKSNNQLLVNESEEQIVRKELLNETVSELLRQITTRPRYKESLQDSSPIDDNPC